MDRLRRCEARDKDGHRCIKHVLHLRESKASETGVEMPPADESKLHRAFGKTWSD